MAMAGRFRSNLSFLVRNLIRSDSIVAPASVSANQQRMRNISSDSNWKEAYVPVITSMISGSHGTEMEWEKPKVKVPIKLFGGMGNYATSLFVAAANSKKLEKVESEVLEIIGNSKKDPEFSEFLKDLSIPRKTRVKYVKDLCAKSGYSDVTTNFLSVLAEYSRLRYLEKISERLLELTRAHKGEVIVTVTTVCPLPAEEDKLLKDTLKEVLPGKTAIIEQKIDPSILGGIIVEFDQKLLDASIKTRAMEMEAFLREPGNFDAFVKSEEGK